ncbi:3'-5' exonuclease [Bittarella massiliensis (ex Durand et al. 2017)]|uniref:3'-5' exonuclease n=1 Tax=Bittarella massiliensis (ex Durand et al. 2017) TaxID=1720313 RepID=UPI00073E55C7|nr:3'-5' exonuclease [Bittarella massiliensis (ex Durand et al. 2017)]
MSYGFLAASIVLLVLFIVFIVQTEIEAALGALAISVVLFFFARKKKNAVKGSGKKTRKKSLESETLHDDPQELDKEEILAQRIRYIEQKEKEKLNDIYSISRIKPILSDIPVKRRPVSHIPELTFNNITPKGTYQEFVSVDVETTGLSAAKDRIIQISAIRFERGEAKEAFTSFVNPGRSLPDNIKSLTGISDELLQESPKIDEILPSFDKFVGGSPLVAHNAEFDIKFLFASGSSILDEKRKIFCTLKQSQKMLKKPKMKWDKELESYEPDYDSDWDVYDHKLSSICEYFNIIQPSAHDSLIDAYMAGEVFLELIKLKQE